MKKQDIRHASDAPKDAAWPPREIAVVFGHVASNIGDLAINRGQVAMLRRAFPGARLHVVYLNAGKSAFLAEARESLDAGGPVRTSMFNSHGERALAYLGDPTRLLDDAGIRDADLVVLSAGEHLFHYQHGENIKSLYWRSLPALAAKAAGKRCLLMPSTLGPFEDPASAELARSLLGLLDAWAVRDGRSGPLLQAGLDLAQSPEMLLDPAFFLAPPAQPAPRDEKTVALVMRSEHWGIRRARAERIEPDAQTVRETAAYGFARAFATDWLATPGHRLQVYIQTDADAVLAGALVQDLDAPGRTDVVRPLDIDDYLARLAGCGAVVASRFHAIILGLVAGTPGWGVYFDEHGHKMPGLFDLLGQPGRCRRLARGNEASVGVDVAAAIRAGEAPGDVPARLDALRARTLAWLADVPGRGLDSTRLLGALRAFGPYTGELAAESVRAAGAHKLEQTQQRVRELTQARDAAQAGMAGLQGQLEESHQVAGELTAGLEAARREHEQARHELEQARREGEAARREYDGQLAAAGTRQAEADQALAALQATHARLVKEAEAIERQKAMLGSRLRAEEGKLATARKQLEAARIQAERDVWAERDHWTSLLSYRLGDVLVRSLARPWTLPVLPIALVREWRAFRRDRDRRALEAAGQALVDESPLQDEAPGQGDAPTPASSGRDAAPAPRAPQAPKAAPSDARVFAGLVATKVPADVAEAAIAMSGMLGTAPDAPPALADNRAVREAMQSQGTAKALRDAYRAAQRTGDYALAAEAIGRIEARLAASRDPADREFLAPLRRSPAYQLSLLRHLPAEPRPRAVPPVPGRVCYVLHNSLPYSSGGYATRSHGIAGGLQAHGKQVVVITRPGFPLDIKPELDAAQLPAEDAIDGIRYQRIEGPSSKGISVPDYVLACADHLEARFAELRPEIVVAASNYRVGLMAMIAARRLGIPFIYEVRGWWELTRLSRDEDFMGTSSFVAQNLLERAVANEADHVFTLTEPMREALLRNGAREVTLVPNSCDPDRFEPIPRDQALARRLGIGDDVPVIGYVGTFVDYEGLDDLAEACGLLAARGRDFRLLLVGNENTSGQDRGPITTRILEIAAAAGFADRLILPGRVPHDEVGSYYSLVDVAPFPRKPWPVCEMVSPMKPLEALAMEKAVVASDVRALAGMIRDGETGLLYRKGDVDSLAGVLDRLMADPALRARLGAAGRQWVRRERTWNAVGGVAAGVMGRVLA